MSGANNANIANGFDAAVFRATEAADELEAWDSPKQKHFVENGMTDRVTGEKVLVTALPLGKVIGERLARFGFNYAHQLIGQYMVCNMDDKAMDCWLRDEIGIKRSDLRQVVINTMRKWCDRHL